MTSTSIFLIRHGETQWNVEQRFQGGQDSPLTLKGKLQAASISENISTVTFDAVYSSPLKRAFDTALLVTKDSDLQVNCHESLREISLGPWEGQTRKEARSSHPKEYENFWNDPYLFNLYGAESFSSVQERMVSTIEDIFDRHIGENVMIVSHWMSITCALNHYQENQFSTKNEETLKNCSVTQIRRSSGNTDVLIAA